MNIPGTQMHIVTGGFILLEAAMFFLQLGRYYFRLKDRHRSPYNLLLLLLIAHNIFSGLFPDHRYFLSIHLQNMIAYGSGFLTASYFPYYFYKAFDLKSLRWHALFGVPLFLLLPYLTFFVIVYALNDNLKTDSRYGVVIPFIYAWVLLYVILKAIRQHCKTNSDHHLYLEKIYMYCAVSPWAAMTLFTWFHVSQLTEVICTNTGFIFITLMFFVRSVKRAKRDDRELTELKMMGRQPSVYSDENSRRYGLTKREMEVAQLVREGLKNRAIAEKLHISLSTVKTHIESLHRKTGAASRWEIAHKLFYDGGTSE